MQMRHTSEAFFTGARELRLTPLWAKLARMHRQKVGVPSLAIKSPIRDRAQRSLSHGGGIEGIFYALMASAGIGLVVTLLIAGMRTAESNALRHARETGPAVLGGRASELGTN